jgi:hypothetical protein
VRLLDEEGGLTDELIVAAASEGEMIFVAHALGRRSGLRPGLAIDELLSGDEQRAMTILRAAAVARQATASLLAAVGDLLGLPDAGRAIDGFDRLTDAQVEDARTWLTTDAAYREAVTALSGHDG